MLSGIFLTFSALPLAKRKVSSVLLVASSCQSLTSLRSDQTQDAVLGSALLVGLVFGTLAIVTSQMSAPEHTKTLIWGFNAAILQVRGAAVQRPVTHRASQRAAAGAVLRRTAVHAGQGGQGARLGLSALATVHS